MVGATSECKYCATASGVYQVHCLGCCARLVRSARPSRHLQENMLAAIEWHRQAPDREAILERLREIDASSGST
jgi:hypothetical protein